MPIVAQGGTIKLDALFRNSSQQATEPDAGSVSVQLRDPIGNVVLGPFAEPPIVNEPGVGAFSYTWSVPINAALGTWVAEWFGNIAGDTIGPGNDFIEVVLPGTIATPGLSFLIKPDDYDAIRAVLGMADADLTDEQIELSTFAEQGEERVKARISNWEDQVGDPDRLYALRVAAAYATAALIAESYAKGGAIGNVYPTTRDPSDWDALATLLWQRHEEWMAMAEAWDDNPEPTFSVPLVRLAGPSRSNQPSVDTVPPWTHGMPAWWRGWSR